MTQQNPSYADWQPTLQRVMTYLVGKIEDYSRVCKERTGEPAYEHLIYRVKSIDSMNEKCVRKGLPVSARSALRELNDAIGIRIVCRFIDDIYTNLEAIRSFPFCRIIKEKDYISHVKPNGYRSYHIIIEVTAPFEDIDGKNPGRFFAELQLRTIAMDSWASLEHEVKYKQDIEDPALIIEELKRCADELAACDLSMQTMSHLIRKNHKKES